MCCMPAVAHAKLLRAGVCIAPNPSKPANMVSMLMTLIQRPRECALTCKTIEATYHKNGGFLAGPGEHLVT